MPLSRAIRSRSSCIASNFHVVSTWSSGNGGGEGKKALRARWSITRSEEHTTELQSLMRISYAVFCWKKKIAIVKHTMLSTSPQHHSNHCKLLQISSHSLTLKYTQSRIQH